MGTQTVGQMFHFQPSEGLDSSDMGLGFFERTKHSQLVLGSEFNHVYSDVNKFQPPVDQNRPTPMIMHSGELVGWQEKQEPESFEPSDFLVMEDESDMSSQCENEEEKLAVKTEPAVVQFQGSCSFRSTVSCAEEHREHQPAKSIRSSSNNNNNNSSEAAQAVKKNLKRRKSERSVRYAFKTRSESDILEDGYKWRKYGKKFVKNSPNPRNYYRCSDCNCDVKKRVERDPSDAGVVITTYEGKHNHESPSVIYYIGKPMVVVGPQHASTEQFPQFCRTEFMFL